jgi:hypothetical protein
MYGENNGESKKSKTKTKSKSKSLKNTEFYSEDEKQSKVNKLISNKIYFFIKKKTIYSHIRLTVHLNQKQ